MIWDFFKGLGSSKVETVRNTAKAKGKGAVVQAKTKAAAKVDEGIKKGKEGAAEKAKGGGKDQKKKEEEKMGLFGKKDKGGGRSASQPEELSGDSKTVALDIEQFTEGKRKECVGWIVALNGNHRGEDFRLVPGKNVIGTSADCDIVVTDSYLSTKHSTIRYEEGSFIIVDLDSTNGTYVNDKRVSREELIDNDKIRLGRTEFKFKSLF